MLLCQFNPHDGTLDPLNVTNDETSPDDFKRLLRAFEDVASTEVQLRHTLRHWHDIARDKGYKFHSWIGEYEKARVTVAAPDGTKVSSAAVLPDVEKVPAERRAELDITCERGARRRILENWNDIEKLHGPSADARQVLRFLKRDADEKQPALKTVQNHLSTLRGNGLIP